MPVVGSALSFAIKVPDWIIGLVTLELTSAGKVAENKDRLDSAGVNPDNMFAIHDVVDLHQKKAMNRLLRSTTRGKTSVTGGLKYVELEDKRRYWLCKVCINCLKNGQPIDESNYLMYPRYQSLAKRERRNEITLDDEESVTILTMSLSSDSKTTNELILHIDSTYFEAPERAGGAPFDAMSHRFKKLGKVIKRQKNLTLLEIHVNSTNGKVYDGLRAVLKCRALKKLRVSGIPCFFNDETIPIKSQKLEELSLQDVHINTKQASNHLWTLIGANPGLWKLKVSGARLAVDFVSKDTPKTTLTQLKRLESLDLSSNGFGEQEATHFIKMALDTGSPSLKRLDLSNNPRIGNGGCERVIAFLVNRKYWLEDLKMKDSGIDARSLESIKTYLCRNERVHPAV
jgi:hypothetical protein